MKAGLRPTKADVKRLVAQGGLAVNGTVVTEEARLRQPVTENDLLHGKYLVLKVGKKSFALVAFIPA